MNLTELGNRIRTRREARGLTQRDLASALQISTQAVSKWERGENAPDIGILPDLARILDVSVDWLLGCFSPARDVFEATVLICGVKKGREFSERLKPKEFAAWTNAVCFPITQAVLRFDGVPVKYIGPGIFCFFSGHDHRRRAVQAAVEAVTSTSEALKIGLGTGSIYLGAIGHPDYARPDVMGEPVSLAMLCMRWADGHTRSGIAAEANTAEGLDRALFEGKERRVRFPGISHKVGIFEVKHGTVKGNK